LELEELVILDSTNQAHPYNQEQELSTSIRRLGTLKYFILGYIFAYSVYTYFRLDASSDFMGLPNVPRFAITMGVSTVMKAKRVVIMGFTESKAGIIV
jgi:hypothetical protein